MTNLLLRVTAPLAAVLLSGCLATLAPPRVDVGETQPVLPVPVAQPVVANGSIFQAGQYRPLFEDHRARLVGDTLTVNIVEKVSATQSSKSTIDKTGNLSAGITALPGISANSFGRASAAGSSSANSHGRSLASSVTV